MKLKEHATYHYDDRTLYT